MHGPGWTIKLERVTPVAGRAAWSRCGDVLEIGEAYADPSFGHVRAGRLDEDQAFACRHCGEACAWPRPTAAGQSAKAAVRSRRNPTTALGTPMSTSRARGATPVAIAMPSLPTTGTRTSGDDACVGHTRPSSN